MDIAVFSVIFQANLKYLDEFINSLNNQNNQCFELFLINDGLSPSVLHDAFKFAKFPVVIYTINDKLTPAQIREVGFKELTKKEYKKIIFADTDDLMSPNRVDKSIEMLDLYPVVFTDITLISENNIVLESSIWKDRLLNIEVNRNFLYDKNVLGLGNSAIQGSFLRNIVFPKEIIAVDWYYFTIILGNQNAGFISDAITFYRQHFNNTIGIKEVTIERLEFIFKVKEKHYAELINIDPQYAKYASEMIHKKKLLSDGYVTAYEINKNKINFFWWEETNYIEYERNTIN